MTLQHQLEKGVGLRTFKRCLTYASDMFETPQLSRKKCETIFFFIFYFKKYPLGVNFLKNSTSNGSQDGKSASLCH